MIKTNLDGVKRFIADRELPLDDGRKIMSDLSGGRVKYAGTGWMRLPYEYDIETSSGVKAAAQKVISDSQALVVVGIGGSYLGARAALDFVNTPQYNALDKNTPDIYFVGNNLSGEHLAQVIAFVENRDFSVNYISKSGSTIEPSVAFRVFKELLASKYGEADAKKRIYITTDASKGKLRQLADREGYTSFCIPDNVGGRYSVLTAVGLFPALCAGIDIEEILSGAREVTEQCKTDALLYACARQTLYRKGKTIELLSCFEPAFRSMGEWWKQLFGESEGKDGSGIFPAYAQFTTDLHSLGQFIQSGERSLFETFVSIDKPRSTICIPEDRSLNDGLDALAGSNVKTLNDAALTATKKAHIDGGVPVLELAVPDFSAHSFGALVQFFEISCAVSALLSGVNPFDQPGVEAYKKNLYEILGLTSGQSQPIV